MKNIVWVVSDTARLAYEIIGKAKSLADYVIAYISGEQVEADMAISCGADSVMLMDKHPETIWEAYVDSLLKDAEKSRPEIILVGSTCRGRDLAAQLAVRLSCPCVTDARKIEEEKGSILLERIVYGGLGYKRIRCSQTPIVVTIAPGTFEAPHAEKRSGKVSDLEKSQFNTVSVVERIEKEKSSVNLADSDIVIGVGRGLGNREGLELFERLAKRLGGELGCSRPVAEDLKWLPEERYLGITGKQIKPKLYLCAGISGQIQHVFGVRESKIIVSINTNENAPIFKFSDYYIVGDLEEVLPALLSELG